MGQLIRIPDELLTKEQQKKQARFFHNYYKRMESLIWVAWFLFLVLVAVMIWSANRKKRLPPLDNTKIGSKYSTLFNEKYSTKWLSKT